MTDHPIIGYDAKRIVRNGTGLGSYGRTLVNDLAAYPLQLRLYAPDKGRDDLRTQVPERPNLQYVYPSKPILPRFLWRSRYIVNDLLRDGVQLYHGLSGELPVGIRKSGIKTVVTIHDLIFLRQPEFYNRIDTKIYAWKFRKTLDEADHIIAISERTRDDILHYAPDVDPSRITLIYQSCSPRFTVPEPRPEPVEGNSPRYILSVGSIETRKNILLAVKALHHLPDAIGLVIVGRPTSYTDQVRRYVQLHRLESRVTFLHDVSNDQLPQLYAQAEAFVYPSRYEGFGIPIIEAISQRLPVVACTGSCLEEAGGPDSLYVDPDNAEGMAHAISQVLFGAPDRQQRIDRSREYIKRFENTGAAQRFVDIYSELVEKN